MIEIRTEICSGCNTCVKVCPHGVLSLKDEKAVLAFEERCIECAACQLNCPEDAIAVTKGVGCLIAIVKEDILKRKGSGDACGCDGCC